MPIIPPALLNLPATSLNYTITHDGIKKENSPTLASLPCSVVIGASRGIGLEFVRQLLDRGHRVIAAVRDPFSAGQLWPVAAGLKPGRCVIQQCDVTSEESIEAFVTLVKDTPNLHLEYLILNAGVLHYPNRASETSFSSLLTHLTTNTVGPIHIASRLLHELSPSRIRKILFISSDSGSHGAFRDHEDGFAAYAASKSALNMLVRHLAAEVKRREDGEEREREAEKQRERVRVGWGVSDTETGTAQRNHGHNRGQSQSQSHSATSGSSTGFGAWASNNTSPISPTASQYQYQQAQAQAQAPQDPPQRTTILAIHPGEVATDMATNVELSWEVEGIIGVEESVSGVLNTVERLGPEETGSFWTWDGRRHLW